MGGGVTGGEDMEGGDEEEGGKEEMMVQKKGAVGTNLT